MTLVARVRRTARASAGGFMQRCVAPRGCCATDQVRARSRPLLARVHEETRRGRLCARGCLVPGKARPAAFRCLMRQRHGMRAAAHERLRGRAEP